MFEAISGHKRQLEFLKKALESGKLAHAYTFAGPEGVGKKMIAKALALELLGAPSSVAEATSSPARGEENLKNIFLPDLLEINPEGEIKIEQIRELTYKLSLKPYSAPYKVAIIDSAENMTTEAANALLKTLEEPKSYTVIFLITSNPSRLPKTILSRTQKISFGLVKKQELEQPDEFFETFKSGKLEEKLIAAYEIADLETAEIKGLLQSWLRRLQAGLESNASKQLANQISQVSQAYKYLEQNVNSKLLLTNLMIKT